MIVQLVQQEDTARRRVICAWCEDVPKTEPCGPKDSELNYGMCRTCLAGKRSQLRQQVLPSRCFDAAEIRSAG